MNNTADSLRPIRPDIVQEAILWQIRIGDQTDGSCLTDELHDWLQQHPDHRLAWQRLEQMTQEFRQDSQCLSESVTPVTVLRDASDQLEQRRRSLKFFSVIALAATGLVAYQHKAWRYDYVTRTGERRSVLLPDGSQLILNTDSAVNILFTDQQRVVQLRYGEIMLQTGSDPASDSHRPLSVVSPRASYQPVGTRFIVHNDADSDYLSVQEGQVVIRQEAGEMLRIDVGQAARVSPQASKRLPSVPVGADAWLDGLLHVDNMRLDQFLKAISRYRPGYIDCDPSVADLRLSGVFQLDDTDKALRNLARLLPVSVQYRTRWWVRITQKN